MSDEETVLSAKELALLEDVEVLPLKKRICEKLEAVLQQLQNHIFEEVTENHSVIPEEFLQNKGRISRGDNYRSFAYRVLDCPAYFDKQDWFTYRTVIMWGHHIGFHLLLAGRYQLDYQEKLMTADWMWERPVYVSVNGDPWEWIPSEKDHLIVGKLKSNQLMQIFDTQSYIRLSQYIDLNQYAQIPRLGRDLWKNWQYTLFKKI